MSNDYSKFKKTLIITLEFPPKIGGISSYIDNFAKQLPSEKITILAPKQKNSEKFDKDCKYKIIRKKMYWLLWPRWVKLFFLSLFIIKKEKIEQIYIHHAIPVGYITYAIKKIFKIPYTIFFHGTDLEYATSKKLKKIKLKPIIKNAEKLIVNSEFLKNKLIERIEDIEEGKIKIIYPCPADFFLKKVDPEIINNLKSKLALNGKKIILTVGRMDEGKGYPHMIRVIPEILKKVPNLVWIIIGEGIKEKQIVEMVQKNNLQNVVRFLGQMNYKELPKYYQLADLFILLTHKDENKEEGWGTVFLEAGASELAVVAGEVGGVKEVVNNMITGILVNPYEDTQVIGAISELLLQPDYAKQMGEKGKTRVKNIFTWEKQINKLLN